MTTKIKSKLVLTPIEVDGYEKVISIKDPTVNLNAIIAIHSTALGPALGGIRIHQYNSEEEALVDALRLSEGMTYKSALAETGFGGGKGVIVLQQGQKKTPELLRSFGKAVDLLKGHYICAEDLGCTEQDLDYVRETTQYVVGLKRSSGNPAPFTAYGTLMGMKATALSLWNSTSLQGKRIAIQGLGSVGEIIAEKLFWEGADIVVADINDEKTKRLNKQYRAQVVSPHDILEESCDILAPCAFGGVFTKDNVSKLRCKAIVGCANNQLLDVNVAELLHGHNILYAPDFVVNAGGLMNVELELEELGYNPKKARRKVMMIFDHLVSVLDVARKNKINTYQASISLAKHRLRYGIGKRVQPPSFHH